MRVVLAAGKGVSEEVDNSRIVDKTTSEKKKKVGVSYMLNAKVADTACLHLPIFNGILDSLPAFQSLGLSTIRTVQ